MGRVRKCPTCCPDVAAAVFDRTFGGENEYACNNCGHRVTIARRPRKVGGAKQVRAVKSIREMLSERFEVTEPDAHRGFWAERGTVMLWASPKSSFDDYMTIYVGPRGAVKVATHGRRNKERTGRDAWIWLGVVAR